MKSLFYGLLGFLFGLNAFGVSRPKMMKRVYIIILGLLIGWSAVAARPANVLLIMTDDLGYHDLSCQGATDFDTPNIDRIAASGVRFSDGYVTAPQCGPSRAGLMTGMSQSRFGCLDNKNDHGIPAPEVVRIIPEQLKDAGYTTGLIGKWHIGFHGDDTSGWATRPNNAPWERGFDYVLKHYGGMAHFFPYREDGIQWMTSRNREPRLLQKLEHEKRPAHLEGLPPETYMTDYFSEQGAEFIRRNQETPWFLFLSYNAPHTPCVAKADKIEKYTHIQDKMRRNMVAMMESVDEGIGQVINALEDSGQLENTLVWFLSDNGGPTAKNGSRNDPFSGLKGDLFEGGIRVPFIVSWPGTIPGGRTLSDPVISLDILPTSMAAAGVEQVPQIHEGKNLLPWLTGQADCPNQELFWTWRSKAAFRAGTLKETRNGNKVNAVDGTEIPGHVFSDLANNPQELEDKALKSPEKRQMLSDRLDAWLRQVEQDKQVLTPKH